MAAINQASCVCANCGRVMGQKTGLNHVLHLVLTVFSGGMWGIFVWLPLGILAANKPYLCTKCGLPVKKA